MSAVKQKIKRKQWRIGEYAIGGIIKAEISADSPNEYVVIVQAVDMFNKINVVKADYVTTNRPDWDWKIDVTLNEMTTSYYADKVMQWIREQVKQFSKQ